MMFGLVNKPKKCVMIFWLIMINLSPSISRQKKRKQSLPVENVIDLLSNERSQTQKFAINTMQDRLQKVSFAWIFGIK